MLFLLRLLRENVSLVSSLLPLGESRFENEANEEGRAKSQTETVLKLSFEHLDSTMPEIH